MTETLIILAGGLSSRMKKSFASDEISRENIAESNSVDKGLITLGNGRPLLDYLLYIAKQAGFNKIIIVTGENSSGMRSSYGDLDSGNNFHDMDISYAVQKIPADRVKPWGTADALLQALEQYSEYQKEHFCVCNSDNLYSEKVMKYLRTAAHPNALINYDRDGLEFTLEKISGFAVTRSDHSDLLIDIHEKPDAAMLESCRGTDGIVRVSMNIFMFYGKMIYPFLINCPINPARNEKELPSAILNMIGENPGSLLCIPIKEHVPDLTEKNDIKKVSDYLHEKFSKLEW
ncbi:MAG: NTP transferase domain-containing protein [Candidatus Marinimicrobia bacterium]|jgi:glucose-1-phosphate adenylyltransferase|nr:NTP transferase domain-containing protein [Candidatus Neomarinimicrobiota bacterium]MBT3634491.1 NTP transferase domain-containing protein [Candidatus Neomarinimicrobiota bacterium]MBT3683388.1 NTP transferase domain-containing protein [Candidatus Neomarinimicrobiota bacterium]MBT3760276.1 NTP transferase domain-containing protein [Candidatus Neomarinimicrobiota bacterium]MBT3896371.1 NTP transferase domain-containing protein [Candidatus Neomarinimicrobiota bacterium]